MKKKRRVGEEEMKKKRRVGEEEMKKNRRKIIIGQ